MAAELLEVVEVRFEEGETVLYVEESRCHGHDAWYLGDVVVGGAIGAAAATSDAPYGAGGAAAATAAGVAFMDWMLWNDIKAKEAVRTSQTTRRNVTRRASREETRPCPPGVRVEFEFDQLGVWTAETDGSGTAMLRLGVQHAKNAMLSLETQVSIRPVDTGRMEGKDLVVTADQMKRAMGDR
jgi:hypothetical protein